MLTERQRPPSLDTINRTYTNIDIAVTQQEDDVERLVTRVSKLKIGQPQTTPRIGRLPLELRETSGKRAVAVTPNVAATTAAALNAERTAQRLKGALLRARKEPLLNKQAVGTIAPSVEFHIPQKPATPPAFNESDFEVKWRPPPAADFLASSNWSLPPFQTPGLAVPSTPQPSNRRRESTSAGKHAKPIKKSPGSPSSSVTSSPPSNFSWGPLPGVMPLKALPIDLRKKEDGSSEKGSNSQSSLSSSWVADGFGPKK